jgi:hypothetical protein
MAEVIQIEGNLVKIFDITPRYEVPIGEIEQYLSVPRPAMSPLLPRAQNLSTVLAWFDEANNKIRLLIERAPRTEKIRIEPLSPLEDLENYAQEHGVEPEDIAGTYDLPLPWEYYDFQGNLGGTAIAGVTTFTLSSTKLWWSKQKLQNIHTDLLYYPRLPNINNADICWGDTNSGVGGTLADKITAMILNFYETPFNEDYGHLSMPRVLSEFPISKDIMGIPNYDWDLMMSRYLDWSNTTSDPVPTIEFDGSPPETWSVQAVREWYQQLTPMRREYVDRLGSTWAEIPEPVPA